MKGKEKCKILKEIRQKIANENDIPFVTSECKHQGDCRGTCPKCEAELLYLEKELAKRHAIGKRIALAGLVATFTLAGTACDFGQTITSTSKNNELDGDMVEVETQNVLEGEPDVEPTGEMPESDIELTGDIPYPESSEEADQ
jgi:hypothetical protein